MQINFETIRQHAGEKLRRIEAQPTPAERLSALKKFLKIETQRLQLRHRFGISGSQIVAARSLIVDLVIQRIARTAAEELQHDAAKVPFAVIALGGYGRVELAPHSDIDVMFLHQGRKEAAAAALLSEKMLYLLWDMGFSVGHSNRSVSECLAEAKDDNITRNSLIDARLLWGSETLFEQLTERIDDEIFSNSRGQQQALLGQILADRTGRYEKFGNVACLQEPNVKETAGGLRDLHTLLWATRVAHGKANLIDLVAEGVVPERDAKAITAAYDFLLRVRNEMHFATARRTDALTLDLQQQVAHSFGYIDSAEAQASESFMRDYYLHARRLHSLCEAHLQRAASKQEKKRWFSRARTMSAQGGFVMRDGVLDVEKTATELAETALAEPTLDGHRMLLAFSYAQATGAPFSVNLQELVQANLAAVNKTFRASTDVAQTFMKLLRAKGRVAAGLRLMHEVGFLAKYLPEFGRVTCLVQHDLYHRFTVDEHTLRTIEVLDELANSRNKQLERYRALYQEISDPAILHMGLLMHDIGKGLGGGHTEKGIKIAERVCERLQLDAQASEQIVFLVRQHLLMAHIAQRRDLSDEKIVRDFAAQIGTLDSLNMLTLLTYGDINGVGPGVWSEWKDTLLWELYSKARALLVPEPEHDETAERLRERIVRMLASEVDYAEVQQHFAMLPEDYARFTAPQVIIEHIRLAHALNSRRVKTSWRVNAQSKCTDLHVCARNRRGLFANLAGALTAQGVNILSVSLNTRTDGLAVDSFKVSDTVGEPLADPQRWEQIDDSIKRVLSGELDIAAAVAKRLHAQTASRFSKRKTALPKAVQRAAKLSWDNQSSDKSTILEVQTADRLGLAYKLASTLASLSLDIVFAKVATEKHLALDVFYVTDAAGRKLPDSELAELERALRAVLDEPIKPLPQVSAGRG
ncbi:MAG: [protein-PII] uridylyltransferase [Acidobacteria bacterium]|nr:[protein-PII] uridylyltransferase [Acidobacteriota bacterium]MBI3423142.1 [protein-PII] uridylyltransferase [Acidobacteriota bacterium]